MSYSDEDSSIGRVNDTSDYLLKREEELARLNEELDRKMVAAVKRVDDATRGTIANVNRLESARPASHVMSEEISAVADQRIQRLGEISNTRAEATPNRSGANVDALHATIKLQKTRIASLQEEVDRVLKSGDEKSRALEEARTELRSTSEALRKSEKMIRDLTIQQDRTTKKSSEEAAKSETAKKEVDGLKSELEKTIALLKRSEKEQVLKDSRISKLTDEVERWKTQCVELRVKDKAKSGVEQNSEVDRLSSECKRLERQRNELLTAFKKQMKLIDLLKRQQAHIEAAKLLSFTEDEFVKILEVGEKLSL